MGDLAEENERLKREVEHLKSSQKIELRELENELAKEKSQAKAAMDMQHQKVTELDTLKTKVVRLTKQLDEEITKRDKVEVESQMLERRLVEQQDRLGGGGAKAVSQDRIGRKNRKEEDAQDATKAATKIIRTVDQWMRHKDLQQALLRGASINDVGFSTLVQVLVDCSSLHTLDLSQNQLTMDSCSDLCQLITTCPSLTYISLEGNLFSLRALGYFMTAIMERHNSKKLTPIDILDMQGNKGLMNAAQDAESENNAILLKRVAAALPGQIPSPGPLMLCQICRSLWKFLHDTGHPQVKGTSTAKVEFDKMERATLAKMESALSKILLVGEDENSSKASRTITAELAILLPTDDEKGASEAQVPQATEKSVHLPPVEKGPAAAQHAPPPQQQQQAARPQQQSLPPMQADVTIKKEPPKAKVAPGAGDQGSRDPFADLRAAFERPKEKCMTFNLKQIITKNGTILMNMLERLLESTSINARDVETGQTLLEYACHTGNIGLAKLCYRRGASLSARTLAGDTPFNISVKNRRYDLMEFLHTYGVKVNSCDAEGRTALHVATASNDVDAICRLIEWGGDVNLRDRKERTPLHFAAIGGHTKVTMLLLETGADMNAKDEKEFTAVAHAEANDHFALMDRLIQLGGRGHGLHEKKNETVTKSRSTRALGDLNVSAGMRKSTSLGRLGKVKAPEM